MEETTVVILAGGLDFGRCPIATRLPRVLWPLVNRPTLECHLEWLVRQGVKRVIVCSTGGAVLTEYGVRVRVPAGMSVEYMADRMPRGAAGCLKDAVSGKADGPVVAMEGGVAWVGDLGELVRRHSRSGADLTVFTADGFDGGAAVAPAGIYVCEQRALEHVLETGYQDIKEQMIPSLLRRGRPIRVEQVTDAVFGGGTLQGYLNLVGQALSAPGKFAIDLTGCAEAQAGVWVAQGAAVSPSARLCAPVAVMEGAWIGDGAVVVGPAAVGRGASVGRDAVLDESVVWDAARIGARACLSGSVVDEGSRIAAGDRIMRRTVSTGPRCPAGKRPRRVCAGAREARASEEPPGGQALAESATAAVFTKRDSMDDFRGAALSEIPARAYIVGAVAAAAAFAWSYSDVLSDLWRVWMRDANYSSGVLVPFLAAYVLFSKRKSLALMPVRPSYLGLALVAAAFVMRSVGTLLFLSSAERFSVILVLTGMLLTVFGFAATWRLRWILLFMVLMLPWPNRIHLWVSMPLQTWATSSAVFVLELLGKAVIREGNILHVGNATVAVAEACSGLRMLTAFMIVSGLVALVIHRSWWEKAILVVSSVPIAVVCNTIRLSVTALAFGADYGPQVNEWFHDFGGIAMMPLALAMLVAELWVTRHLFYTVAPHQGGGSRR